MFTAPPIPILCQSLVDNSNPVGMRMRAAYHLRQGFEKAKTNDEEEAIVSAFATALRDPQQGSLLRHEVAYVMGQVRSNRSVNVLCEVLDNGSDCVMVRHECAEALGAINSGGKECLTRNGKDPAREVAQTCQLSLDYIEWKNRGAPLEDQPAYCACMASPYNAVDPAPPHPNHANWTWEQLGNLLCDLDKPLFARYRALFSLRNRGGDEAVHQLCRAIRQDCGKESDALLRHEVAYVLGQLQHPEALDTLHTAAADESEHVMVRHECAEAMGALEGGDWTRIEKALQELSNSCTDASVRDSCLVALDAADYWRNTDESALSSFAQTKAQ